MKVFLTGLTALMIASTPAMAKDRTLETLGGALLGGFIGNEVGGKEGAIIGAIGGGVLANQIAKPSKKKYEPRNVGRPYYGPPHKFAPYNKRCKNSRHHKQC